MNELIKKASETTFDDINIVYEDNHVLVVVKPINIPVQEDSTGDNDLLSLLKQYRVQNEEKDGDAYLGLVHRLDRPTGGVMVFAKTSKAAARLHESLLSGDFEKKYFAVIAGEPNVKKDKLTHYLKKNDKLNKVFVVPMSSSDAKKAVLEYEMIDNKKNTSLLAVKLFTGRNHQIRVQLSHIGYPILGDKKYGNDDSNSISCPLALWAYELKFTHPTTKEKMVFRVAPPEEFAPWSFYDIKTIIALNLKY